MNPKLYVPVNMRALIIGRAPDGNCFADISNDFSRLKFSPLGEYVPSQLSAHRDMQKGVHLHWSLPDALTRGVMNSQTDDVEYPPIPNRWLLTRLWSEDNETIKAMSFMIESDAVSDTRGIKFGNVGSPTIPDEEHYGGFLYLGRAYRCGENMPETRRLKSKLTAILPGNALYTAFYPDCRNVLGFYDDMTDYDGRIIENANVTYAVAGWFNTPEDDVISAVTNEQLDKSLEMIGWRLLGGKTDDTLDATICHAMLCGIEWEGPDAYYELNIPQADLTVAIGNNSNEALAAMLSGYLNSIDKSVATETMLTHLLSGRPAELLSHDGIVKSEVALFEARFGSENIISSYSLKWDSEVSGGTLTEKNRRTVPEPSNALSALLAAYNRAQESQAALLMEIQSLQEELFDTWFMFKRGLANAPNDNAFINTLNELGTLIAAKKDYAAKMKKILDNFDVPDGPFGDNLKEAALAEGFILSPGTAGRFWIPNPPVVLISNIAVNNAHGADGQYSNDKLLNVRKSLVSSLTIKADVTLTGTEYILSADKVLDSIQTVPYCPAETLALAREAALLSHSFSALFAKKMLKEQPGVPDQKEVLIRLTKVIRGLQTIFIAASAKSGDNDFLEDNDGICGFNGPLPEKTAVEYHTQPWYPLYMEWKADYYPDEKVISSEPSIGNWRRKGFDLVYDDNTDNKDNKTSMLLRDAVSVSGRTFLTPHAGQSLSSRLGELGGEIPSADLIRVLSQSIPELHEQLMMRSLQIMPSVFPDDRADVQYAFEKALEGYNPTFPLFNSLFSPIRGGFLKLRSISLIDTFGQFLESEIKLVAAAESLRRQEEVSTSEIMLPPRLLQPTRLNFDFSEGCAVCGFVLPNFFDNNITFFSADGNCIGTLQLVRDGNRDCLKLKMPPEQGGRAVEKFTANEDLVTFIKGITDKGVSAFISLMKSIDSALAATNPASASQFNSLAFLLGRPLALARANVSIETLGPRRKYRNYTGTTPPHNDVDVSKLEIPLRLGFRHRHNDGLFGFFIENDFSAIHFTGHAHKPESDYVMRGKNSDYITVRPNTGPISLALLMDPMADVNLTSSLLPLKSLRMNPVWVQAALRKLYHVIFVAPVIQYTDALSLPIFPVEGKKWSWSGFDSTGLFNADNELQKCGAEAIFSGYDYFMREGYITLKNENEDKAASEVNTIE